MPRTRVVYLNCETGEEEEKFYLLPKKDVCKLVRKACKSLSLGWGMTYQIFVCRNDEFNSTYRMYRHYPKRGRPRRRWEKENETS